MGTELLSGATIEHRTQKIVLWLIDDDDGDLMYAIRAIQEFPLEELREFDMFVTLHDGEKPVETFAFVGCRFDALQHSVLSVEPVDESVPNRANSMKLLQIVFAVMTHTNHKHQTETAGPC